MADIPDGTEVLIACLKPLGTVNTSRKTGAPLPSWVVRRIGGPVTALEDQGLYSVHAFAATDAEAQAAAMRAYDEITALAPPFGMGEPVTLDDGRRVWASNVIVREGPRENVGYTDDRSILDWVASYEVWFRRG